MKATPLIINWHETNAPIYTAHFEPHGRGRLATGGGDRSVRLWKVGCDGEDRRVEYLSTLSKHTQAVNVVRWAPKGELLASAGDDGNVILWVQCDTVVPPAFGSDGPEDKESWRAKHMCRSSGAEIYDLAWSPDSAYFIIGSMDNIARIYSSSTGALVRQVAEHSHYVQGVAWDPLNEYIATQSSDRSVHIYSLRTKDGQYTLTSHDAPSKIASHSKADLPPRRISSSSPAPPEFGHRSGGGGGGGGGGSGASSQLSSATAAAASTQQLSAAAAGSPVPSAPGTPTSMALPMNPPSTISHGHSRRSSLSSRRSLSPAPSMPLPAVMPMEASPKPLHSLMSRNSNIYLNETLTSFFRRLTFTPDGSLLLTPSGQYQSLFASDRDARPSSYETTNTVYIYSRGGINKPPIGHLPGHKKPTIAVKCSPVIYTLRPAVQKTRHITIDSSSAEDPIASLPEPVSKAPSAAAKEAKPSPVAETKPSSFMEPPPPPTPSAAASDANAATPTATTPKAAAAATPDAAASSQGPIPTFALPYRIVYAVATQESVLLYDTQQKTPLCVVSNLHCATFTDLAWSTDGLTLLITSSDGFCSTLSFSPGELGAAYTGELAGPKGISVPPTPAPTAAFANPPPRGPMASFAAPSPPATAVGGGPMGRPASPARSNSTCSIPSPHTGAMTTPTLIGGSIPSITAASPSKIVGVAPSPPVVVSTPPETPRSVASAAVSSVPPPPPPTAGAKRDASESERGDGDGGQEKKKRRIAPTVVESRG